MNFDNSNVDQLLLVSIIIPVFNREKLLLETLQSIVRQTYYNWECIVVDDQSTDNSYVNALEFSRNDSRFKILRRPIYLSKGANSCRNFGYQISKGYFLQWFDSDDLMSFDMLEKKVKALLSNEVDLVVCEASFFYGFFENEIPRTRKSIAPVTDNPAFEYFSGNFWFGTPQAFFRREVISSLPYIFNKNLNRNQETELYVRILLRGLKIFYLEESLIFIRLHDNSISSNYAIMSIENQIATDLDAYISMFLAFKINGKLSDEVLYYFSNYFFRCLRKIPFDSLKLSKLFIFGIKYNLFPSRFLATKIFIYRLFKL